MAGDRELPADHPKAPTGRNAAFIDYGKMTDGSPSVRGGVIILVEGSMQ
jgi:hypothetical protein